MAWFCGGKTNRELVTNLRNAGIIKSEKVYQSMVSVDRKFYAPVAPYEDSPSPIGWNATISAPHMHAYALEFLAPVLGIGSRCNNT